jgi:hypothetical protein
MIALTYKRWLRLWDGFRFYDMQQDAAPQLLTADPIRVLAGSGGQDDLFAQNCALGFEN